MKISHVKLYCGTISLPFFRRQIFYFPRILKMTGQEEQDTQEDIGRGKLLGIGNPLLDLTVNGDEELLQKYKLEANNAILASESQKEIYSDLLENYDVQFTAGGSVQNSLRVCQWILREPRVCVFMGSVGRDKYSKILEKTAENDGVEVRYQYQDDVPTGTCAVIITTHEGSKRSLCANLAAAEKFTISHINTPENFQYVENAQFYYLSGFFVTVSLETVLKIGEIAKRSNKPFITNLSAPFICSAFKESLLKLLPYTDILFGNETEALTFAENSFDTKDVAEIAKKIANMPKENKARERIVIITQGSQPVLCATGTKVKEIKVPALPKDRIVDTNGAGDAFAGGFLSQLILGKDIEKCIECGIWAAGHIIQQSGCSFNKETKYVG